MFAREFEWDALTRFATDPAGGATLGVVSGRRRQGKTFLLRALCEAAGGFFFGADEATDGESLRRVGAALADRLGAPAPLAFDDWYPVFDALLALGSDRAVPVVIERCTRSSAAPRPTGASSPATTPRQAPTTSTPGSPAPCSRRPAGSSATAAAESPDITLVGPADLYAAT